LVRKWLSEFRRGEAGIALPVVLILLTLGSLMLIPSLNYVTTSIQAGERDEKNIEGLYVADAGVEDALWIISNNATASLPHSYQLTDINGMSVDVTIDDVYMIGGEEINPPAGHVGWMEITKSVNYTAGIYYYTMYLTNKGVSNIKMEWIFADFPANLSYEVGSTGGDITTDDPVVSGDPTYGISVRWDFSPPNPTIEPGPDPGGGEFNTEIHTFQLSGPPDIEGVEGHSFIQAARGDVSTVADVDSHPFEITAQAKDAAETVVATIKAGVYEGDGQLEISLWQINP